MSPPPFFGSYIRYTLFLLEHLRSIPLIVRSGEGNRLHVCKRSHVIAHAGSYVTCVIMGSRDNFETSFEFTASGMALVTGRTENLLARHQGIFLSRWSAVHRPCVSCVRCKAARPWRRVNLFRNLDRRIWRIWRSPNLADEPATCSVTVMHFKELLSSPHPVTFRVPGMEFRGSCPKSSGM